MAAQHDKSLIGRHQTLIGTGLALAAAGTTAFLLARRGRSDGEAIHEMSDAPDYVWRRGTRHYDENSLGNTVTINRPREALYDAWRDFALLERVMENVEKVEKIDQLRSRWTIKAPLGSTVDVVTRIRDDQPGAAISWESEPGSDITTDGRIEFLDAPPGRGSFVRLSMRYAPPGGLIGKGISKLLQREPRIQSRRDLRRFKQLMETGEVATNASPSGRAGESPSQPRI